MSSKIIGLPASISQTFNANIIRFIGYHAVDLHVDYCEDYYVFNTPLSEYRTKGEDMSAACIFDHFASWGNK